MLTLLIAAGLGLLRVQFETYYQRRMYTIPEYETVVIRAGMMLVGLGCWAISEISVIAYLWYLPTLALPCLHGL